MSRSRLLALDVDGTLLRSDGEVAAADRAAIVRANAAGIIVTLATGRLSSSTLPVAHDLALVAPLVCADGAVLYCPQRCEPLSLVTLAARALDAFLACIDDCALAPFVFTHDAIYGEDAAVARYPWVAGWTPNIILTNGDAAAASPADIVTAIGIGTERAARDAAELLQQAPAASGQDLTVFPIGATGAWVVRIVPPGCSKSDGLERLCTRLGVTAADVVAVGDGYNDIPMLTWAGLSFAMGQAPKAVKAAAKQAVGSTAQTGGAVAEIVAHLLGS